MTSQTESFRFLTQAAILVRPTEKVLLVALQARAEHESEAEVLTWEFALDVEQAKLLGQRFLQAAQGLDGALNEPRN